MRTTNIVDEILKRVRNNKNYLKPLCGLPISPYFSAVKLKWLLENQVPVQEAVKKKRCMFGTVDSWLIWVRIMILYHITRLATTFSHLFEQCYYFLKILGN